MYISLIDFRLTSTEAGVFWWFDSSPFDCDCLHRLWKYICHICTGMYWYCSTLNRSTLCTVSDGIWNTDYTGLKWSNVNQFWWGCGRCDFVADVCSRGQVVNG